ncbi:glycoside hydrolase superfamily [Radiomyces spectabilis]|uniref:glycoside hydrolase superfamily n=1 Tax=Radiomyces spectabilis TaxID=64574 RepID=UPI00221FF9F3|nr:glycoside hydrolase superfamily [Radiomyces spectabilis]KAI8369345.1 glycoside hydrolase superfamily [Radiomyces spectabilis]
MIYWGQGGKSEKPLEFYCKQEGISGIVLAFIADYVGGKGKSPVLDLSSQCKSESDCSNVAKDIKQCQDKGIKVILSLGGASGPYRKQKFDPDLLAWWLWNMFLGGDDDSVTRPFGDVVLDGVDFDPEAADSKGYDRLIHALRQLYKLYPPRKFLITAAPQCPDIEDYEDNAMYSILYPNRKYDAYPDLVFVQFYNNDCSASAFKEKTSTRFNFDAWDKWATEKTKGKSKIFLGLIAKSTKEDSGYVPYEKLTSILDEVHSTKNFGGVMMWDARLAYDNRVSYLHGTDYATAVSKYLRQLTAGGSKAAIGAFNALGSPENHHTPVLVPISNLTNSIPDVLGCSGQAFVLLRHVTCRTLAESFGMSGDDIDRHLVNIGIDVNALLNPGSHICMEVPPEEENNYGRTMVLSYVYNATISDSWKMGTTMVRNI